MTLGLRVVGLKLCGNPSFYTATSKTEELYSATSSWALLILSCRWLLLHHVTKLSFSPSIQHIMSLDRCGFKRQLLWCAEAYNHRIAKCWRVILRDCRLCWENGVTSLCAQHPPYLPVMARTLICFEYPLPEGENDRLALLSLLDSLHFCFHQLNTIRFSHAGSFTDGFPVTRQGVSRLGYYTKYTKNINSKEKRHYLQQHTIP